MSWAYMAPNSVDVQFNGILFFSFIFLILIAENNSAATFILLEFPLVKTLKPC